MTQVRVITTTKIDKTVDGTSCYLMRSILALNKANGVRSYKIRNYYVDKDIDGNITILGQKDSDRQFVLTSEESDLFYASISGLISLGSSYVDFINTIEQQALLYQTNIDKPYGFTDWEIV